MFFSFINMVQTNGNSIDDFSYTELKKLYRYFIYLHRPFIWKTYRFFYKKFK